LQSDFNLDRVLAHGTLPGMYADRDPESRSGTLRSYVDAYLREEIQAEALVRDIGGYSRLLDLAAASSGRVVNLHALSRDAAVSYETARRYLDVLEDTLLLFWIPAWRGSDRASLVAYARKDTRRIVLFLGERRQQLDDVEVLPLEDFLAELPG
jgi:predicted AAA+ superfamily ATPase